MKLGTIIYQRTTDNLEDEAIFDRSGDIPAGRQVQIQMDNFKAFGHMPVEQAVSIVARTIQNKATKTVLRYTIIEDGSGKKEKKQKQPGIAPRGRKPKESESTDSFRP